MPLIAYLAHFASLILVAPFIANPGGRWSLFEDGYATGSAGDAATVIMYVIATLYMMYYAIPIIQAASDKGGAFIPVSIFISGVGIFFLYVLIKGQWISIDSSSDWAWCAIFIGSLNAAYAVTQGGGAKGLVGLNFIKWFMIFMGPGSMLYNPTGWSLLNDANATGGKGDYLVGFMLVVAFVMVLWCGAKIIEACKNGGKVFLYQCVALAAIFVTMIMVAISNGLVTIDTQAGWVWCGMVLASIIGALAIAKADNEEQEG
jgi:hypothetical protein